MVSSNKEVIQINMQEDASSTFDSLPSLPSFLTKVDGSLTSNKPFTFWAISILGTMNLVLFSDIT